MKNRSWLIAGLLVCAAASVLYQSWRVEHLKFENSLLKQMREIDSNQIRELMWIADNANRAVEADKTRAYLAGFTDAQTKPQLTEVWHAGYSRGAEVTLDSVKKIEVYSEIRNAE